jgi:hypothetical protein
MLSTRGLIPYSQDMALASLGTTEAFLVSSLRLWNSGEHEPAYELPRWRTGFAHARVSLAGALAFERFCRMIALAAEHTPSVRALGCERLSADEIVLLLTLGYAQHAQLAAAGSVLRHLCPAAAVRLALQPARELADALAARRLWLPLRLHADAGAPALIWESQNCVGRAH